MPEHVFERHNGVRAWIEQRGVKLHVRERRYDDPIELNPDRARELAAALLQFAAQLDGDAAAKNPAQPAYGAEDIFSMFNNRVSAWIADDCVHTKVRTLNNGPVDLTPDQARLFAAELIRMADIIGD